MRALDLVWPAGIIAVGWLAFNNRSSEKVLTAVISAAVLLALYIRFAANQAPVEDTYPAVAFCLNPA